MMIPCTNTSKRARSSDGRSLAESIDRLAADNRMEKFWKIQKNSKDFSAACCLVSSSLWAIATAGKGKTGDAAHILVGGRRRRQTFCWPLSLSEAKAHGNHDRV